MLMHGDCDERADLAPFLWLSAHPPFAAGAMNAGQGGQGARCALQAPWHCADPEYFTPEPFLCLQLVPWAQDKEDEELDALCRRLGIALTLNLLPLSHSCACSWCHGSRIRRMRSRTRPADALTSRVPTRWCLRTSG